MPDVLEVIGSVPVRVRLFVRVCGDGGVHARLGGARAASNRAYTRGAGAGTGETSVRGRVKREGEPGGEN